MKLMFIGWNHSVIIGDSTPPRLHDKVWGVFEHGGEVISFWGRRTGRLTFKKINHTIANSQIEKKSRDGYQGTSIEALNHNTDFKDRFDSDYVLALCGNFFHRIDA